MKPEEQRIAIAQWCGWKAYQCGEESVAPGRWRLVPPNPKEIVAGRFKTKEEAFLAYVSDYLNDLNAMHEVEERLSPLDHQKFCLFLHKSIMGTMDNFDINGTCNLECISRVVKATAAQRAEALLRTIGKWQDDATQQLKGKQ